MLYFILYFILFCYVVAKLTCGKSDSRLCLIGKTAIITGANSGIGYTTAVNLASRGCRVIITGRTKMEEAREKLIKETNSTKIVIKYLYLESFKSVRKFADEINKSEEKIDILIHNAGTASNAIPYTEDKLPFIMQVNYFAPFLLTHLLIDKLKKSDDPRIVFVSSVIYMFMRSFNLETITKAKYLDYPNSKYCQILAMQIFAEKLKPLGIKINALHPGIVKTQIMTKCYTDSFVKNIIPFLLFVMSILFGKDTEEGAQPTIHLATSEKVKNVTGKYFMDCFQIPATITSFKARNKSYCEKLWKLSEELAGLKDEEKIL